MRQFDHVRTDWADSLRGATATAAFIDAVLDGGRCPLTAAADARATLAFALAAQRSAREGRRVPFDEMDDIHPALGPVGVPKEGPSSLSCAGPGDDSGAVTSGGQPAAGWLPDPSGRHEHRYWDGAAWTGQVADGGVTATDPLGPGAPPAPSAPPPAATWPAPSAGPPVRRRRVVPYVLAVVVLVVGLGAYGFSVLIDRDTEDEYGDEVATLERRDEDPAAAAEDLAVASERVIRRLRVFNQVAGRNTDAGNEVIDVVDRAIARFNVGDEAGATALADGELATALDRLTTTTTRQGEAYQALRQAVIDLRRELRGGDR